MDVSSNNHLLSLWLLCFGLIIVCVVWLVYQKELARRRNAVQNRNNAIEAAKAGQKRRRQSHVKLAIRKSQRNVTEAVLDMANQTVIFMPLATLMIIAIHTVANRFPTKQDQALASFVFALVYMVVFSILAVIAEFYIRAAYGNTKERFQLTFIEKMCIFLNHGISGVLGKLMQYGAKSTLKSYSDTKGSACASSGCRMVVFATVTTITAIALLLAVAYLPGSMDFLSLEDAEDGLGNVNQSGSDDVAETSLEVDQASAAEKRRHHLVAAKHKISRTIV